MHVNLVSDLISDLVSDVIHTNEVAPVLNKILLEAGDDLLLENGSFLLKEA